MLAESDQVLADQPVGREEERLCLLASQFLGLSDPTRLSILLILANQGETRVGALVKQLNAPQPRVSDHLRMLCSLGYVEGRRQGRAAYYSIADQRVIEMIACAMTLLEDNRQHIED